jgi:hypothetical protein
MTEGELFKYLFEGAKSSGQDRIEDFITELIGFMWEIDLGFKEGLTSFLKNKISNDKLDIKSSELVTQKIVMKPNFDKPKRYDIVLEINTGERIVIENKIDSEDNQFIDYLKSKNQNEIMLLLIPKAYKHIENIDTKLIIHWESLIIHLRKFMEIDKESNNTLKLIRKSFFNYLFDYAGLIDNESIPVPSKSFLLRLEKYVTKKNQKKRFLRYMDLFPLGFHSDKPYFGIELTDFSEKSIELILEDKVTKLKEDKKEHNDEIKILNSEKFSEQAYIFEKEEQDATFFEISLKLNNNIYKIEKDLTNFIKDFYEEDFSDEIILELKKFVRLINKLIEISGNETEFKENIIKYYVYLKRDRV